MSDDESNVTSESDSYEAWLRREVEAGLKETNDPSTVFSTLEEVKERMRLKRAQRSAAPVEPSSYEEWLKRELAIGIAEADDPDAVSHSVEDVEDYLQQQRTAYLRRTLEKAS
jgi:hypothetical protein